jgi:uncharacterized membrane protein
MKRLRDAITWIVLLGQAIYLGYVWPSLPSVLPSHFNLSGHPDRSAPREILWFIFGLELLVLTMLTVVQRLPHLYNLPATPGDPERPRQEALTRDMLAWLRLEMALMFAYILWSIVSVGLNRRNGVGSWFIVCVIVATVGTVLLTLSRMRAVPVSRES